MPLTTTVTWPSLVAGRKAKASEVEAKFDYLEGDLWPMASGTAADNTYMLGNISNSWKATWTKSINPTTSAAGIAVGQFAANANTCLDLSAMPKALYMPVLTTTQRDALTPAAGMMIYNSTALQMQRYEGGQWLAMNNPVGMVTKVRAVTTSETYEEALNVSGSGILRRVSPNLGGDAGGYMYFSIDGTTYNTLTVSPPSAGTITSVTFESGDTTAAFAVAGSTAAEFYSNALDVSFKSSLIIYHRCGGASNSCTTGIVYERS